VYLTGDGERVGVLNLNENNLTGFIPSSFGDLTYLSYLRLDANQLSGIIPPELGNLTNLYIAFFSNNQLSGHIPPELGNIPNLGNLILSHNELSGNIPKELGNLFSSLYGLDLSYNQLSGSIPLEVGELKYLQYLSLNDNQLSGPILPEFGNFKTITSLDLSHNQLSGGVPPSLGNISTLYSGLNLSHNQLSGSVPSALGNLFQLKMLDLSYNKLSGTIPSSIVNLPHFLSLNISHNRFTFNGMELIAQTFPFAIYDWQMPIPLHVNGNTLSVSAGGTLSNNAYVWYKQGKPGNTTIKGDSVFHPTESGTYFVKVRNKIAKGLKLVSRAVKYTAPASFDAVASNKLPEVVNSFSVYPNPAKNVLYVTINGNASFSLMNEDGKILLTANVDKTRSMNISDLAAGVYYLKNNNTNATKKIAVIK
jgi:hypothetical protein